MDIYKATEIAYKNGYNKGSKETAENILKNIFRYGVGGQWLADLCEEYGVELGIRDPNIKYVECKDCQNIYDCEYTYLGGCTDGQKW